MKQFALMMKWSSEEFPSLPWRENRTLYSTLVSEIMLQQTTVQAVMKHFDRFMKVYPDVKALAIATEEEVLIEWKGLGYYRRARNLHKAARYILEEFGGEIPLSYDELTSIPGIGDYTASAIISIGANRKALAIDANISRIVSRFYDLELYKLSATQVQKKIKAVFSDDHFFALKGFRKYRALNEAFMDLGRVICRAKQAHCDICPLRDGCLALKNKKVESYIERPKKKIENFEQLKLVRFVVQSGDQIMGELRNDDQWLAGQLELPSFVLETTDSKLSQYPRLSKAEVKEVDKLILQSKTLKTSITKYRIENVLIEISKQKFSKFQKISNHQHRFDWFAKSDRRFSSTTSKVFKKMDSTGG